MPGPSLIDAFGLGNWSGQSPLAMRRPRWTSLDDPLEAMVDPMAHPGEDEVDAKYKAMMGAAMASKANLDARPPAGPNWYGPSLPAGADLRGPVETPPLPGAPGLPEALRNPPPAAQLESAFGPADTGPSLAQTMMAAPSAMLAPVQPMGPPENTLSRTFSGLHGTTNYEFDRNGQPTGAGNFRGLAFKDQAGQQQAEADWHLQQGHRETGIPGVPSVESIMNNQLFGVNLQPDEKRRAAITLQMELAGLGEKVHATSLAHQGMLHSKLLDAATFNAQRIREGGGSDESSQKAFNDTLKMGASALPDAVRAKLGVGGADTGSPAQKSGDPVREAAVRVARNKIRMMVGAGQYNVGLGQEFANQFLSLPDADRATALKEALATGRDPQASGGIPELSDALFKAAAHDYLVTHPAPIGTSAGQRFDTGDTGLPFDIISGGLTKPAYIVTKNNKAIPFHFNERPNTYARGSGAQQQFQESNRRLAAYGPLLEQFLNYGK